MNSLFSKVHRNVLVGVLSLGVVSAPVLAITDVLDTPAVKSALATSSLLIDLAYAGNRVVAVGERGDIVLSDDQGKSWEQADVPVSVLLNSVNFVNAQQGWAVGHSGVILHTSNGGKNWVKQFDGNQANKMIITQSENQIKKLKSELAAAPEDEKDDIAYEVEEAVFALEDAKADADVGASKPLLDVLFSSSSEGFVVGAYGFFFKTVDGGLTWSNYGDRIENPDRFHLNTIALVQDGTLLIAGEAGVIFRSVDKGETWESIESPYEGSFFGLSATKEEGGALIFGLRGNIFRTDDSGKTWNTVDSNSESTLMSSDVNDQGDITIVGNSGAILFSKDGGKSFSEYIRENRLSHASNLYLKSGQMVIVGEEGIVLTNLKGESL